MVGPRRFARRVAVLTGTVGLAASAWVLAAAGPTDGNASGVADPFAHLPEEITLGATIRDFKGANQTGGHADFESFGNSYIRMGLVAGELDSEGKPVIASLKGSDMTSDYKDKSGRTIYPPMYDKAKGDVKGTLTAKSSKMIASESGFAQWFRDVPSVNMTKVVPLTLTRVAHTNRFVFDSASDASYKDKGGFFPIDGELMGNTPGWSHNFSFTTEVKTEFVYLKGTGQTFKLTGDDDLWVFIDARLVLDVGGLHPKKEMFLDLDRLSWLEDGGVHKLSIFHAERHTGQSNFRIETTLELSKVEAPSSSAAAD